MTGIVSIRLHEVELRLKQTKRIKIEVDDVAKKWLAVAGFSPQYGARPLNRVIQQEILFPLSRMVLDGSVREKETAYITADHQANRIVIKPNHQPEVEMVDTSDEEMYDDDMDAPEIEEIDD